ncbi:MAG TPA: hypothetical protein VFI03_11200 [Solirubrobacterales bacterium]|nr:hypothetical protein [Solirubrobacterales bacterium]
MIVPGNRVGRVGLILVILILANGSRNASLAGEVLLGISDLKPCGITLSPGPIGLPNLEICYFAAFEPVLAPGQVQVEVDLLINGSPYPKLVDPVAVQVGQGGGCGGGSPCPNACCLCGGTCPFLGDTCVTIGDTNTCGCGTFRFLTITSVPVPPGATLTVVVDPDNAINELAPGAEDNNVLIVGGEPVPALSRWALALLGLLLLATAIFFLRRLGRSWE